MPQPRDPPRSSTRRAGGEGSLAAGVVLLQAARAIAARCRPRPGLLARVVEECVFGADLDPVAVDLTKAALWLEVDGRRWCWIRRAAPALSSGSDSTGISLRAGAGAEGLLERAAGSRSSAAQRLSTTSIYRELRRLGERVQVKAWPHGIRHGAITTVLDLNGGDVRAAQRFSRHQDVRTLLRGRRQPAGPGRQDGPPGRFRRLSPPGMLRRTLEETRSMAEQDVTPAPNDSAARPPADAGVASAPIHIGAIVLGLGLVVGAVSNRPVGLSNQVLPEMPAPGVLAVRILVGLVGAGLLIWGLWGLWFGPALIQLRPSRFRQPAPPVQAGGTDRALATEGLAPTGVTIRLRDEEAIVASHPGSGIVDSIAVWFEIVSHLDLDVVLDRIVLGIRAGGQPVLHGIMGHRTPVPSHSTVPTIFFEGMLTSSAAAMIQKCREMVKQGGSAQFQVTGCAYFDSAQGPFVVQLRNLQRNIPSA